MRHFGEQGRESRRNVNAARLNRRDGREVTVRMGWVSAMAVEAISLANRPGYTTYEVTTGREAQVSVNILPHFAKAALLRAAWGGAPRMLSLKDSTAIAVCTAQRRSRIPKSHRFIRP